MRTVSLVYVKETEVQTKPLDVLGTLAIRFQIDDQAIEVWFDDHSRALNIRSPTGNLRLRPRADNVIILEAVRFDAL